MLPSICWNIITLFLHHEWSLVNVWHSQVTLQGMPKKPEDHDDYQKNRGPIPKFHSVFGCIQDVVSFSANDSNLGENAKHQRLREGVSQWSAGHERSKVCRNARVDCQSSTLDVWW